MNVPRALPRFLLAACLAAFSAACPEAGSERPNVLLIAVDTLRADRLGCYGNTRGLTPHIDRLAAAGARFSDATSHAPWTLPSFASLFTSLYPPEHGAGGNLLEFKALPTTVPTLAERFRDAGYATAAITNVDFLGPSFGLARGFVHHDSVYYQTNEEVRRADATTDAALAWLAEERTEPWLLFVHYFDAHASYDPPAEFRARFAREEDRNTAWRFGSRAELVSLRQKKLVLEEPVMRRAEALYDAEVAFVDQQIGRLLDETHALDPQRNTVIVLTADHGEEFLDHGSWEHGHTVYQELVHVPLIVVAPGRVPRTVVDAPVRHIDVAPTLCELADVPLAPTFRGRSLVALAQGGGSPPTNCLSEGAFIGPPLRAWRHGDDKVIVSDQRGIELFDLRADPREAHDRSRDEFPRAMELVGELELADKAFARAHGLAVELSDAERARLAELGYTDR